MSAFGAAVAAGDGTRGEKQEEDVVEESNNDEEDDEFAAGLLSRVRGVKPRGKAPAIQWPMVICSTM